MSWPVMAPGDWPDNGAMMADVASLYLEDHWVIWDPTYGLGNFWTRWRPGHRGRLIRSDLAPAKSPDAPDGHNLLTDWPLATGVDAMVIDPPYKLNGTDQGEGERYGVADGYVPAATILELHAAMVERAATFVRTGGLVLVKVQDMVSGGRVRWQTDNVTAAATWAGLEKVDTFLFPSYRPQPADRRQVHARRNYSTLLLFRRLAA